MTTANRNQQPTPQPGPIARHLVNHQLNGQQVPSSQPNTPQPPGKKSGWGFADKTVWDWLNLSGTLAIPLVVVAATIAFGIQQANLAQKQHDSDQAIANQQHAADQQQALDQQRATILQAYIDNIQDLLLNHHLLKAGPTDDVAILARARTLTALQGLDSFRKGVLIRFLYEAHLIGSLDDRGNTHPSIIDLTDADLVGASLDGVILAGVNLSQADLSQADLSGSSMDGADLEGATLSNANLYGVGLSDADLGGADLKKSNVSRADLTGATLYSAYLGGANLSLAVLIKANLKDANLRGADLSYAILCGADLSGKDLSGKKVCADLSEAYLADADLKGAIITRAQLTQAKSLTGATMPDGSKHP